MSLAGPVGTSKLIRIPALDLDCEATAPEAPAPAGGAHSGVFEDAPAVPCETARHVCWLLPGCLFSSELDFLWPAPGSAAVRCAIFDRVVLPKAALPSAAQVLVIWATWSSLSIDLTRVWKECASLDSSSWLEDHTPVPRVLPCGGALRKRPRGLQAHSQLHHGAQATGLRGHAFDLAAVHPQAIAQASIANGACSFTETAQNAGLALGGKICVGHICVVVPSAQLRKWFGHDPKRWIEFKKALSQGTWQQPHGDP